MGLDMYLHARRAFYAHERVGTEAERATHSDLKDVLALHDTMPPPARNLDDITVEIEVAYWRKANQIHQWFVDNVQGGIDECQHSSVSITQLTVLRDLCRTVLADRNKAASELPTQSGFFFGPTDYETYYWQDLEETDVALTKLIDWHATQPEHSWLFTYHSSW